MVDIGELKRMKMDYSYTNRYKENLYLGQEWLITSFSLDPSAGSQAAQSSS